ncbi:MAG: DUF421 domain-containing protein [Ruminococcaceae bacterium]|nr:DUF421 domain-containing protein [Oscillospiraceae bacterium]
MLTILLRTIIIYIVLLIVMRLMGKRQIGELEISDLVTTFLLSEIASLPITDTNIPVAFAIIPMIVLLMFEVTSSWFLSRFPSLKNFLSARPATLISNGKINRKEMLHSRISIDELIGELRQNGISDISTVRYAILEQNGKISVIQNASSSTPSAEDFNIKVCDNGIDHILISDGSINKHSLKVLNISIEDIEKILEKKDLKKNDVYLMLIDDNQNVKIFKKDEN